MRVWVSDRAVASSIAERAGGRGVTGVDNSASAGDGKIDVWLQRDGESQALVILRLESRAECDALIDVIVATRDCAFAAPPPAFPTRFAR